MSKLTITEVKRRNKAAGYHFFDKETMKIFSTKIETGLLKEKYFITSDKYDSHDPKGYTIREVDGDRIETVAGFRRFKSVNEAKEYMKRYYWI